MEIKLEMIRIFIDIWQIKIYTEFIELMNTFN